MLLFKKTICSFLLLGVSTVAFTQQLHLESMEVLGGKSFASFLFKNSFGEKDQLLDYTALNNYGIRFNLVDNRHSLRPELLFQQAGAVSDFNGLPLSWKLNYMGCNFSYKYDLIHSKVFTVSPGIGIGAAYLLNGEQYIGNVRYSINESKSLKAFDIGFHSFCYAKTFLTDALFLSLEYRFGMSIISIENDSKPQQTRNIAHSALLGIGYTFNQSKNENHE
jgi:hypothetical protein